MIERTTMLIQALPEVLSKRERNVQMVTMRGKIIQVVNGRIFTNWKLRLLNWICLALKIVKGRLINSPDMVINRAEILVIRDRIVILSACLYHYPWRREILHTVIFPIVIYGTVFILWMIWVNKFAKKKKVNT